MKRIVQIFLVIFFPWLVFLMNDDPIGALLSLVLQASVVGWIPASIWAWRVTQKNQKKGA